MKLFSSFFRSICFSPFGIGTIGAIGTIRTHRAIKSVPYAGFFLNMAPYSLS